MNTPSSQSNPPRIGIIANPQFAHGRNFLRGVTRYIEEQRPEIQFDVFTHNYPKSKELIDQYDGFISATELEGIQHLLSDVEVIWVGHNRSYSSTPQFDFDDLAIGRVAAETLHQQGIIAYGYYDGSHDHIAITNHISQLRLQGYRERISQLQSQYFDSHQFTYSIANSESLAQWIQELPKPAGIFAFNDLGALKLVEACNLRQISIPNEVMIVGVDNDRLLCTLNQPRLTSVDPGMLQLSYNAMQYLVHRIESPEDTTNHTAFTQPVTIAIKRETTDQCSNPHPIIQSALSHIEKSAPHSLSPTDLAAAIGVNLRSLEIHFKTQLGQTIQQSLLNAVLHKVKQQLRDTPLSIEKISALIDWEPSSLQHAFKRVTGKSAGAYRAEFRRNTPTELKRQEISQRKQLTIGIVSTLTSNAHHNLLRGMQDYCQAHPDVQLALRLSAELSAPKHSNLDIGISQAFTDYDGFIVTTEVNIPDQILQQKPIITIEHTRNQSHGTSFHIDNYRVGKLAADHLIQKGYSNFAYISYDTKHTNAGKNTQDTRSQNRFNGFFETLVKNGITNKAIRISEYSNVVSLAKWLRSLPSKTAIFSFNDTLSRTIIQSCHSIGRNVPNDLAVISTDNDTFICNLSRPTISSIGISFRQAGYDITQAMVRVIQTGKVTSQTPNTIHPLHVIERESSAALGISDVNLENAIRYIKQHHAEDITVEDVVAATELSRRALEILFKRMLQRTIQQELQNTRIQKAMQLLTSTRDSVKEIATQCGFKHSRQFCQVFKKQVNQTPLEYREAPGS